MPLVLITAPASEPLTSDEALTHLRVEGASAEETAYVSALVVAARQWVEKYLGRALVTQTWDLFRDGFPEDDGAIELAKGQLSSVTSVTYYDEDGVQQTLDAAKYQVDTASQPGRILPGIDLDWPDTQDDRVNAVCVRFVAGYGAASAVPEPIKAAMKLFIGHLYEHRESEITGTIVSEHKLAIDALLSPYRIHGFGGGG